MFESSIKFRSRPVKYIPALGFRSLTPFFDSLQKWGANEAAFKPKLILQARIQGNFKVLDLGCGTGTLALLVKKNQPLAEVTAIDIDPNVLSIAKKKVAKLNLQINFDIGTVFSLPYLDNFFDRVVSSFVFHHLTRENKLRTLKEVRRILKVNGELHIADFGKPQNRLMRLSSVLTRRLEETEDNVKGLLPQLLQVAGFKQVQETSKLMTIFGTVSLYKAIKK